MESVTVTTQSKTYDILFRDSFDALAEAVGQLKKDYSKALIISDSNVGPLYAQAVAGALNALDMAVQWTFFPAGEANKNYTTINGLYEHLIESRYDRDSLIIALGGGVTGDMAGFAAATYMRGIDFIQVPTSLLAMVDSSSGGKTGMDFNGYKNIVGAFWQPELVYINTAVLETLPEEEFACGMGEALKHGFIRDKAYLAYMANHAPLIRGLNHEAIARVIGDSCAIKAGVVAIDEKEQGLRAILNFGHTIGHAIERLMDFKLLHGQCVALGMVASVRLAVLKGDLKAEDLTFTEDLLTAYALPIHLEGLTVDKVYEQLYFDKKTRHNTLNIVMLKAMGEAYQNRSLTEKEIKEGLEYILGSNVETKLH